MSAVVRSFWLLLHLLSVVVWVGGMVFAHFALRPAANWERLTPAGGITLRSGSAVSAVGLVAPAWYCRLCGRTAGLPDGCLWLWGLARGGLLLSNLPAAFAGLRAVMTTETTRSAVVIRNTSASRRTRPRSGAAGSRCFRHDPGGRGGPAEMLDQEGGHAGAFRGLG